MSINSDVVVMFLTVEDMKGVKSVVCPEVSAHRNSDYRITLTFNVFNLTLDFASNTAKLEN